MTLVEIAGGLVLGFFLGIGAALFYIRWKMRRQLGNLEEQMGALMDGGMEDMMPDEMEEIERPGPEDFQEEE